MLTPVDIGLPTKFKEFRSFQWDAIQKILVSLSTCPRFILEAPTGSGKTICGASVQKLLGLKAVYNCTTKSLQDQVLRDFPYAKVLKGRANYPCPKMPNLNAGYCVKGCEIFCAYKKAKTEALESEMAVLNTS